MVQCFKYISFTGSERYVRMFFYCIWYDWQGYKCSSECLWAQCWSDVRCFDVRAFIPVHHSVIYMIDDWMDGWLVDWLICGWLMGSSWDKCSWSMLCILWQCISTKKVNDWVFFFFFNLFMWEVHIF